MPLHEISGSTEYLHKFVGINAGNTAIPLHTFSHAQKNTYAVLIDL